MNVEVINPSIALNDDNSGFYVVSYTFRIADQSVSRALKVSFDTARMFSERHNVPMPQLESSNGHS